MFGFLVSHRWVHHIKVSSKSEMVPIMGPLVELIWNYLHVHLFEIRHYWWYSGTLNRLICSFVLLPRVNPPQTSQLLTPPLCLVRHFTNCSKITMNKEAHFLSKMFLEKNHFKSYPLQNLEQHLRCVNMCMCMCGGYVNVFEVQKRSFLKYVLSCIFHSTKLWFHTYFLYLMNQKKKKWLFLLSFKPNLYRNNR